MSSAAYATLDFISPAVGECERVYNDNRIATSKDTPYSMYYLCYYFNQYKDKWISETLFYSNPSMIVNNQAYKKIIALGNPVIPLILNDLLINDNHWFYALAELTGQNPIKEEHYGDITQMKNDWVRWGKINGLL